MSPISIIESFLVHILVKQLFSFRLIKTQGLRRCYRTLIHNSLNTYSCKQISRTVHNPLWTENWNTELISPLVTRS